MTFPAVSDVKMFLLNHLDLVRCSDIDINFQQMLSSHPFPPANLKLRISSFSDILTGLSIAAALEKMHCMPQGRSLAFWINTGFSKGTCKLSINNW